MLMKREWNPTIYWAYDQMFLYVCHLIFKTTLSMSISINPQYRPQNGGLRSPGACQGDSTQGAVSGRQPSFLRPKVMPVTTSLGHLLSGSLSYVLSS
jgi:hypothetical protein